MSKIFRVFFSSTFNDFVEERNALQKEVFPQLKDLCAAYGARFQPIDLRWGIPEEVAVEQSTMQICLEELKRCQDVTLRPNFLILLGERYGWTPPPSKIPKTEFDQIFSHFSEKEKALIEDEWYKLDENELVKLDNGIITSVYELQPRGEKYANYDDWKPIEREIRKTLLEAARKSKLPKNEMVKYFASATHQEIVLGALEAPDAETHVHCFFRKTKGLPDGVKSDNFIEPDRENRKNLSNLKDELVQHLLSNIHQYEVDLGNLERKNEYLERFCKDVYESLVKTILKELEEMTEVSALDEEVNAHIEFGKSRTKVFVGRESILKEIVNYVESDDRAPFVVFGEPGSGKSALMAKVYELLKEKKINAEFILRFFGTSVSSSSSIGILRTICEQIAHIYGSIEEEIPFEYNKLVKSFNEKLSLVKDNNKAVLILDALDQLSKNDPGRSLGWLPNELPENAKIIVSVATDAEDIMEILKKKLPKSLYTLEHLSYNEGNEALNTLLKDAFRKLQPEQKKELLEKFSQSGSPLYLKLAFEEARTWNSYDNISHITLPLDIEGLIQILFKRLYKEHTKKTVEKVLSYIVAARNGLTEDEILDVMTSDTDYFNWYKEKQIYYELPENRLPWIVWSRLRSDLEPYLTMRGVDHTSTIVFFHRQFNDAIEKHLLAKVAEDSHRVLANYFDNADFYYQRNKKKTPNYRKLSELVYNLREAKMWNVIEKVLTNLKFIEAKFTARMTEDLMNDYKMVLSLVGKQWDAYIHVEKFLDFILNQAHILREYPHITFQQAINQPESSILSQAGKDIFKQVNFSKPWIEWINKPQEQDPCILTLKGHSDRVMACAFSPDGTRVVSASWDHTLKLWDSETGAEIRTLTGHSDDVVACAFSPDGTRVVSASNDDTLKLWDTETGAEIRTLTRYSGGMNACAFSPDGTKVVSASGDNTLKLWNAETGAEIRTFTGHSFWVNACAFSPDGTRVVSASWDHTLKLWDTETGAEIKTFMGHSDEVVACVFSPDGMRVVSASFDKTLKLWDAETGAEIRTITGHSDRVWACAFSPDGTRLVSASRDHTLRLWDTETGTEIRTIRGHSNEVHGCAFSPDGKRVVSASGDYTLKLWDIKTDIGIKTLTGHSLGVKSCAFSPDGMRVVSASWDRMLKFWEAETGTEIKTITGHSNGVSVCVFSPDGTRIVSASEDKTLKLWDAETGIEIKTLTGHSGGVNACAFSPDGTKLVSSSFDKTLKLWDAETGAEIKTLTGHSRTVEACAFSPDGTRLASASWDHTLKLWDTEIGVEIRTLTGHSDTVEACAFSPDGTMVLSASFDETLKLWDGETGAEIRTFMGHSDRVYACAFSPDGTRVVSASGDHTIKLWDAETGAELIVFPTLGEAWGTTTIGANNLISVGDDLGGVYILRLHGIDFGPAIITPVKLYNFSTKSYDKEFSINCKWCGVKIPLNDELIWQKSEDHLEGRLGEVMECPSCRRSLKFTSFVVGKR